MSRTGFIQDASLLALGTAALIASSAALAAQPSDDVFARFKNVVIVNAPSAAPAAAPSQGGMRAYIDASGALRQPTTEEMQAAAAESRQTSGLRRAATEASATRVSADGTVEQALDESSLQYTVVTRQDDGTLAEICVTGPDQAAEALKNGSLVKAATQKGLLNVR